jgi:hypothetical protein
MRRARTSARELYWKVWGLTNFLSCAACGLQFPLCELDHCAFHPQEPCFASGDNTGCFPCCGQPALRFDPNAGHKRGCQARRHVPDLRSSLLGPAATRSMQRALETAQALGDLVLVPFAASRAEGHLAGTPRDGSSVARMLGATPLDDFDGDEDGSEGSDDELVPLGQAMA